MRKIIIGLINFYQKYLSFDTGILAIFAPGGACKHFPTCSEYTKQAVVEHGVVKGIIIGGRRIINCR